VGLEVAMWWTLRGEDFAKYVQNEGARFVGIKI
jgi:hypothetical protein